MWRASDPQTYRPSPGKAPRCHPGEPPPHKQKKGPLPEPPSHGEGQREGAPQGPLLIIAPSPEGWLSFIGTVAPFHRTGGSIYYSVSKNRDGLLRRCSCQRRSCPARLRELFRILNPEFSGEKLGEKRVAEGGEGAGLFNVGQNCTKQWGNHLLKSSERRIAR